MTRQRFYGSDTPFGKWLRDNGDSKDGRPPKLPSNSIDFGLIASDVDFVVKNWKRRATGVLLQSLMLIEIKTRGSSIRFPQDALLSDISRVSGDRSSGGHDTRFWGWFGLILSGTSPLDSEWMRWCRYKWGHKNGGCIVSKDNYLENMIDETGLISIIRFDLNPCSLRPWRPEIDHHGKTVESVELPLFPDGIPHRLRKAY